MSLLRLSHRFRELRKSPRYDVHYAAHLDVGGGSPPLNCVIADISTDGAKLTTGARQVPDEVTLVFRRRCRVIWRAGGQVGVEFVS